MTNLNLITCIVQKGRANEIIAVALGAGASGATYFNARGTGVRQKLGKILSGLIIPEKDVIQVVVSEDKKDEVFDAITEAGVLKKKGRGVAYMHALDRVVGVIENEKEN